ncbi:hypothetical protein PMZ80_004209 [Knufia obscura]|uniref:Uncharacterized protein n=1 Tax=Knufia obscura TaxID=1635080 RepID=A0ABR0RSH4_9EURO|nr:hypothetical protein PMZ80_004209 [Knufia obscura]
MSSTNMPLHSSERRISQQFGGSWYNDMASSSSELESERRLVEVDLTSMVSSLSSSPSGSRQSSSGSPVHISTRDAEQSSQSLKKGLLDLCWWPQDPTAGLWWPATTDLPDTAEPTTFRLFDAPSEIRNRIYDMVFECVEVHAVSKDVAGSVTLHPSKFLSADKHHHFDFPSRSAIRNISLANKQLRNESLARLWCKVTTIAVNGTPRSTLIIPRHHLRHVVYLTTGTKTTRLPTLLRPSDLPRLKRLTMTPYDTTNHFPGGWIPHPGTAAVRCLDARDCAKRAWELFVARFVSRKRAERSVVDEFLVGEGEKGRGYEVVFVHQFEGD